MKSVDTSFVGDCDDSNGVENDGPSFGLRSNSPFLLDPIVSVGTTKSVTNEGIPEDMPYFELESKLEYEVNSLVGVTVNPLWIS